MKTVKSAKKQTLCAQQIPFMETPESSTDAAIAGPVKGHAVLRERLGRLSAYAGIACAAATAVLLFAAFHR